MPVRSRRPGKLTPPRRYHSPSDLRQGHSTRALPCSMSYCRLAAKRGHCRPRLKGRGLCATSRDGAILGWERTQATRESCSAGALRRCFFCVGWLCCLDAFPACDAYNRRRRYLPFGIKRGAAQQPLEFLIFGGKPAPRSLALGCHDKPRWEFWAEQGAKVEALCPRRLHLRGRRAKYPLCPLLSITLIRDI
jgi:hypothetical protein